MRTYYYKWQYTYMVNCEPILQEDGKLCCRSDFPRASKSSKAFNLPGLSCSDAVGDVAAEMNKQIHFCSWPNVSHNEYASTMLVPSVCLQLHLNTEPLQSMNNKSWKSNMTTFFPHILALSCVAQMILETHS
jgi:hypothetical protein